LGETVARVEVYDVLNLQGKVAVVTGAGSVGPGWGNGRATAALLARQGAAVFLIDVVDAAVEETRKLIESEGHVSAAYSCDMTSSSDVQKMVRACLERFGRIDILVNNVGGSALGDPITMTEESWDRQINLNLKTVFLGCKYVLPVMEAQGRGAIVNVSSVAALRNMRDRTLVGYSSSKAAVIQFSRSTAGAFAKKGIRCNTVIPGLMHTPLVEHRVALDRSLDPAELIAKRTSEIPMGYMGTGWDIAHAVLFLVSDEAGYITGTEIIVDGGFSTFGPGAA
jgi:NAD(P)-dependent dehydrogenase (short-subunit alcohol dehydrogenase family)